MNVALQRAKVLVAAALCRPPIGRLIAKRFENRIPNRGCVIEVDDAGVAASTAASLFFGFYESAEIRMVQRYLPRNVDVVELGASLGAVSAQIARRLAPGWRLVCVEANAALLPLLRRNVHANAPHAALTVVHGALDYSSSDATAAFVVAAENVFSRLAEPGEEARAVHVPRVTLSALLEHHRIADYVLVSDVEGAEAGLLERDKTALRRCRMIVAELHATSFARRRVGVEDLVRDVEALGFTVVARHGPVGVFASTTTVGAP